jgi:2-dehydro-3-deoxygluconokinase
MTPGTPSRDELGQPEPPAPEVATFGETMILLLAEPGLPLEHATTFRRQVVGAESNLAIGLVRLGHRTRWVGRVGDDAFGSVVLRQLRGEGIDVRASVESDAPTGVILRDAHGERPVQVVYHRQHSAGGHLRTTDLVPRAVEGVRILHVTGITPALSDSAAEATYAAVAAVRAQGGTISFDPNLRRSLHTDRDLEALLGPLVDDAHLVLTGTDEALALSGREHAEDAAGWFLDRGAELVVLKSGRQGAWATDGTRTWRQTAMEVTCVDPVGAGDAFDAGFLSGWLDALAPDACLLRGTAVAAAAIQVPGDTDGLPGREQLERILAGDLEVRR